MRSFSQLLLQPWMCCYYVLSMKAFIASCTAVSPAPVWNLLCQQVTLSCCTMFPLASQQESDQFLSVSSLVSIFWSNSPQFEPHWLHFFCCQQQMFAVDLISSWWVSSSLTVYCCVLVYLAVLWRWLCNPSCCFTLNRVWVSLSDGSK